MENIYAMLARIDFLDEVMENERKKAAKVLQDEMRTFVAHYGQVYIIRKDDECKEVELKDLSIEEIEFLRKFMVDTLNNDPQYQEDEIDRYIDLY